MKGFFSGWQKYKNSDDQVLSRVIFVNRGVFILEVRLGTWATRPKGVASGLPTNQFLIGRRKLFWKRKFLASTIDVPYHFWKHTIIYKYFQKQSPLQLESLLPYKLVEEQVYYHILTDMRSLCLLRLLSEKRFNWIRN